MILTEGEPSAERLKRFEDEARAVARLSHPNVLSGHGGPVITVAVSPDGKWIASAAGSEIRLWPMPDVSKPPLHTLPYAGLMAKLQLLTNLRVVEDPAAALGYRLEVGAFAGWQDMPTW